MAIRSRVRLLAAVAVLASLGCARRGGGGLVAPAAAGGAPATATPGNAAPTGSGGGGSAAGGSAPTSLAAATGALPVVFVHGINGEPSDWQRVALRLARGRRVYPDLYAGDSDALATGAAPNDALFLVGYYRERSGSPRYYADRHPAWPSIGGCPVPRTDPHASRYAIAYADQIDRIVENVCRATGSDRIDLVCFSMGGIVGRAYTRWRSVKAPGGFSRVRRLLTVSTMNHGLNALEASTTALAMNGAREHAKQGEAAEMDYECRYWGGQSFIEHLDDGWDAFCAQHGIAYAAAYGHGNAIQHELAVTGLASLLNGMPSSLVQPFLAHPVPNFDLAREQAEASGDGDGAVRAASAMMDPALYPGVRFNAPYFGTHADESEPERGLKGSTWCEALVRRFVLEGRTGRGFAVSHASIAAVTSGNERTWLRLDVDVVSGEPLAAQVVVRTFAGSLIPNFTGPFGLGTKVYSALLHPGRTAILIDPSDGPGGWAVVEAHLYGLDGEATLPPRDVWLHRGSRVPPALALPAIGAPAAAASGGIDVPVSPGPPRAELAFALVEDGGAAAWSPFAPRSALSLPPLQPGAYELRLRARAPANAAGIAVEAPRPDALRIVVGAAGNLSFAR